MVKHTQTIRRQFADEFFEFVWPFCEIGAWRANYQELTNVKSKNGERRAFMWWQFHEKYFMVKLDGHLKFLWGINDFRFTNLMSAKNKTR